MFGQSFSRVRDWWEANTEDILGGDLPPRLYAEDIEYFRGHPHRLALGIESGRRPGRVAARPADCVSPRLVFDQAPRLLVG